MLNANQLLQEGIKQVIEAGIEPGNIDPNVTVNTRAKTRFGQCRKVPYGKYDYQININALLLGADKKKAMNTMVHEILHTVKGCMNHGALWKSHANTMNNKFGYDISRTSSYEKVGIERPKYKYIVKCKSCGIEIGRQKKSKLITQISRYKCRCGGKLELV